MILILLIFLIFYVIIKHQKSTQKIATQKSLQNIFYQIIKPIHNFIIQATYVFLIYPLEVHKMNDSGGIVIKKSYIIIGSIVILLLLVGALIIGLNWDNWFGNNIPDNPSSSQSGTLDIDSNASEWNGEKLQDKTEDKPAAGIKIPGYPSITLPANQKNVSVALLNPEGNPCYFVFELLLKDTGESLYTSKLVPPGQAITQISLSRALGAGEYNATIKITTYSTADQSPMNGANVETVLIVK